MEKRTYPYKEPSDFQKIKDIIEHQLGVKESDLLLTSNIRRLCPDYLDFVDLMISIEATFTMKITYEDSEKIQVIEDALKFVNEAQCERAADVKINDSILILKSLNSIADKVQKIISDQLNLHIDEIQLETEFKTKFSPDCHDLSKIQKMIQSTFEIELTDEDMFNILTLEDALKTIMRKRRRIEKCDYEEFSPFINSGGY